MKTFELILRASPIFTYVASDHYLFHGVPMGGVIELQAILVNYTN